MSIVDFIKRLTLSPKVEINENLGDSATKSKVKLKKSSAQNVAGRDVNVTNASVPIPNVTLGLDGDPARSGFGGFIKNISGSPLVAVYIEIAGVRTDLNQQFNNLCPLQNLNYPEDTLTSPHDNVHVVVRYRSLTGEEYELLQDGTQQSRADSRYNVIFMAPSTIRRVSES